MSDRNRVIDALIAEHAMGSPMPDILLDVTWTGCKRGEWKAIQVQHGGMAWIPCAYSTDPAASKQLRDRMRELGWEYEITVRLSGYHHVRFDRDIMADSWDGSAKEAESEELATVLAALSALGIEAPK